MKEDDLTNKLIRQYKGFKHDGEQNIKDIWIEPEAHYNYFGDRGSIDLFIKILKTFREEEWMEHKLIEIKSTLDNANEVIRQVNRHNKYFYKDEDREKPVRRGHSSQIKWELIVLANESNLQHLLDYINMYISLEKKGWKIYLEHPSSEYRIPIRYGRKVKLGEEKWIEYTKRNFSDSILSFIGL